jgi:sarcosine oxidase subunit gamma
LADELARVADAPPEPLAILRVRGEPREALLALGRRMGLSWPLEPNTAAGDGPAVLWLSPREWLIVGRTPSAEAIAESLGAVVHHLTDATDQLLALDLKGPLARALAGAGCSLDLHPAAFGPGRCAATQLAGVPVTIRALGDRDLRLYVDVSLAPWLRDWLTDAASTLRP